MAEDLSGYTRNGKPINNDTIGYTRNGKVVNEDISGYTRSGKIVESNPLDVTRYPGYTQMQEMTPGYKPFEGAIREKPPISTQTIGVPRGTERELNPQEQAKLTPSYNKFAFEQFKQKYPEGYRALQNEQIAMDVMPMIAGWGAGKFATKQVSNYLINKSPALAKAFMQSPRLVSLATQAIAGATGMLPMGTGLPKEMQQTIPEKLATGAAFGVGGELVGMGARAIVPVIKESQIFSKVSDALKKINAPKVGIPKSIGNVTLGEEGTTAEGLTGVEIDPVKKLNNVLKNATKIRKEQEISYTKQRTERIQEGLKRQEQIGGEKGFYAKLSAFKGQMDKVEFNNIRNQISQSDIDDLFNMIKKNTELNGFDKIPAEKGLAKIFGEFGGSVPTNDELSKMRIVFGEDLTNTLLAKRPLMVKMKELGYEVANIPRSMLASFDLSAPLRQGLYLGAGHPVRFLQAGKEMFGVAFNEKKYQTLIQEIKSRPTYQLMKESKLFLPDFEMGIVGREERFKSSLAEKIPVLGAGVRASSRAYNGFLAKLRADVFDDVVRNSQKSGLNLFEDKKGAEALANYVNWASGRGKMFKTLENSSELLNATIFSPRLVASRFQILNPLNYTTANPIARKEALKSLLGYTTYMSTLLGLGKMAGAQVVTDRTNSDYGKIKIGNVRLEISGGLMNYIVLLSRLQKGYMTSSVTGKRTLINQPNAYKGTTSADLLGRFIEMKEAPVASFVTSLLKGKDVMGKQLNIPAAVADRFIPMVIQDLRDVGREDPSLIPIALTGIFGTGVQTYSQQNKPTIGESLFPSRR